MARAVKFVDLLREGVVSKEEYERLVEPVKERKRKAERMAAKESQAPRACERVRCIGGHRGGAG